MMEYHTSRKLFWQNNM